MVTDAKIGSIKTQIPHGTANNNSKNHDGICVRPMYDQCTTNTSQREI